MPFGTPGKDTLVGINLADMIEEGIKQAEDQDFMEEMIENTMMSLDNDPKAKRDEPAVELVTEMFNRHVIWRNTEA